VWHRWNVRCGGDTTLGCLAPLSALVDLRLPVLGPPPDLSRSLASLVAPVPPRPHAQAAVPAPPHSQAMTLLPFPESLPPGHHAGSDAAFCYVTWLPDGRAGFRANPAFSTNFMNDQDMDQAMWASGVRPELCWARYARLSRHVSERRTALVVAVVRCQQTVWS
jgi:hypothetical protein